MWVVERKNKFISGIFKSEAKLNKYLAEVKKAGQDTDLVIFETKCSLYPIFILENSHSNHRFSFFSAKASALKFYEEEELNHGTLYTVTDDYVPPKAGTDYMGALHHDHLGDED